MKTICSAGRCGESLRCGEILGLVLVGVAVVARRSFVERLKLDDDDDGFISVYLISVENEAC